MNKIKTDNINILENIYHVIQDNGIFKSYSYLNDPENGLIYKLSNFNTVNK